MSIHTVIAHIISRYIFVDIERQISTRSTREELIRRGILKDVDVDEGRQSSADTGSDSDGGIVLGESFFSMLVNAMYYTSTAIIVPFQSIVVAGTEAHFL